jgi:hypothetical protein
MAAAGKWLGLYVGKWFGDVGGSDGTTYVDAALVCEGHGTADLAASVDQAPIYPVGICTNTTSMAGGTIYRPARKRLFRSQWWKTPRAPFIALELRPYVEPLKPFETFDAVLPAPTFQPAPLIRTRARTGKARLHRSAAPAIPPAALIRSKPTFLPLIRS